MRSWVDWAGSWYDLWQYRDECFKCEANEYLDLKTKSCALEWKATNQIAINDTQFGHRLIFGDSQYYINPESESIIELGTIEHPYKQISYAFDEILNYNAHNDRNMTIYLIEYVRHELLLVTARIINITYIEIKPYKLRSTDPDEASIISKDNCEISSTPGTCFNIIRSYDLKYDGKSNSQHWYHRYWKDDYYYWNSFTIDP